MDKKRFEAICVLKCMRAIILILDLWLLISVVVADYFCVFCLYLTLLLSNYFYLFISIHKALLPNRQVKRLLTNGTSKNLSSKPVRGG